MDEELDDNGVDSQDDTTNQDLSPEDDSETKTVSLKQFKAALKSQKDEAEAKSAALQREIEALKTRPAPAPPPAATEPATYTRAQLKAAVTAGQISQDDSDTIWDNQIRREIKREVSEAVTSTVKGATLADRLQAEVAAYKGLVGNAWVAGSPEGLKVQSERQYLLAQGFPDNLATDAAALRAAFGPVEALKAASKTRSGPAESHAETGGDSRPAGGGADPLKSMSARQKVHFTHLVNNGFETWASVRKQLTKRSEKMVQKARSS